MKLFKFRKEGILNPKATINESSDRQGRKGIDTPETEDERQVKEPNTFKTAEDVTNEEGLHELIVSNFYDDLNQALDFHDYQEKLGLEPWEMEKLMKACVDNTKKGTGRADLEAWFKELEIPETEIKGTIKDLADIYPNYLASLNEYSLPFSEEDIKYLKDDQKENYKDLKEQFSLIEKDLNIDYDDKGDYEFYNYSEKEAQKYLNLYKKIISLENRFYGQIQKAKEAKEKIKNPDFKDINRPEYSDFDIEIQNLAYEKLVTKNKQPLEVKGRRLSDADIAELALEAIERMYREGEILKGHFTEGDKKGQLSMKRTLSFKDGREFRDMIYVHNNVHGKQAGEYTFTMNLDTMKVLRLKKGEKINSNKYNIAIVNVKLDLNIEELKELAKQRESKKEGEDQA
jgi:hypothetical protein